MSLLSSIKAFCRQYTPGLTRFWRAWLRSKWMKAWRSLPATAVLYDGEAHPLTKGLRSDVNFWRTFEFDEELRAVFAAYAGGDILDIGASHGAYGVVLAPKIRGGDRYVAFEPDSSAFPSLLKNVAALAEAFPHVEFLAFKLPAGDGQGTDVSYPMGPEHHPCFASRPLHRGERGSVIVDNLVVATGLRPNLIKVDVEGAEYAVLLGLEHTLKEWRPKLFLEVHPDWLPPGVEESDIEALLARCGYQRSRQLTERHQYWEACVPEAT